MTATQLLDVRVPGGAVSEAGVRADVRVALAYLDSWLRGYGAAAIDDLIEDAATAEIARSQLWFWRWRGVRLEDGRIMNADVDRRIRDEERARLTGPGLQPARRRGPTLHGAGSKRRSTSMRRPNAAGSWGEAPASPVDP